MDQIIPCSSCINASSTTPDSSGNGNDLGFPGTGASDELISDGRFSNAFHFDGNGTGLPGTQSSSLQPSRLTVLAWVRASASPGTYRYLVSDGASGCTGSSYALYTSSSGGLVFYVRSGSASFALSPDAGTGIWNGAWHAVAGTYDGSTVHLYVDGHEVGGGALGPAQIAYLSDTRFDLADYPGTGCGSTRYVGDLDEVRVYDRALSASEVSFLQTSRGGTPPELSAQSFGLSVSKTGTGSGTITSQPPGISCGTTCSASYSSGTSVTLTAAADQGSTFAGWSGDCSGTGTCTVTMGQARNVTAAFDSNGSSTFTLNVARVGGGTGIVTSQPAGISCGLTCSASYASGTTVTLTATPEPNSSFVEWSGDCSGTGTCNVTMSQSHNVTADFTVPAGPPVNTKLPSISGTARQFETLTGDPGFWQNGVSRFSYAWLRCAPDGTGCAAVPGATSTTYTPTRSDIGFILRFRVIASNEFGDSPPAESAPTAIVQRGVITAKLVVSPNYSCTGIPVEFDARGSVSPDGIKSYSFYAIDLYADTLARSGQALITDEDLLELLVRTEADALLPQPGNPSATDRIAQAKAYLISNFEGLPVVTGNQAQVSYTFTWNRASVENPADLVRDATAVGVVITDYAGHTAYEVEPLFFAQQRMSETRRYCPKIRQLSAKPNAVLTSLVFPNSSRKPLTGVSCLTRVACVGSITMTVRRSLSRAIDAAHGKPGVLASAFFRVPPHQKRKVTLTLTKLGKRLLHRGARLPVRITVMSVSPTGRTRTHVYSEVLTR